MSTQTSKLLISSKDVKKKVPWKEWGYLFLVTTRMIMAGLPALIKKYGSFSLKTIAAHSVTYFIAGAIAYPLITKPYYIGPNPIFAAFWRTEADPALWAHVTTWFIPAQLLRGLLLSLTLYPFYGTMINWGYLKRFFAITGLYLMIGFWAAAVAAPGTIEGLVYMRPEVTLLAHLKVQPEIIVQGLGFGAWLAAWMIRGSKANLR